MDEVKNNNAVPFSNGNRQPNGQFGPGNSGGPGNSRAKHVRQMRERLDNALFKVVSPDRLVEVIDSLLRLAQAGDVPAARLLLERLAGPVLAAHFETEGDGEIVIKIRRVPEQTAGGLGEEIES
jgi:hypothetical protein